MFGVRFRVRDSVGIFQCGLREALGSFIVFFGWSLFYLNGLDNHHGIGSYQA